MAITKEVRYDMEILGEWAIHVRRRDAYVENGEVLSANFFRYVINVTDDYSSEPTKVKKMCAALFTADAKASFIANQVAMGQMDEEGNPKGNPIG